MSKRQSSKGQFEKVGECLYRYSSTGSYYARIKVKGKEVRRSLKTKDRDLAKRRLRAFKDQVAQLDLSAGRTTLEDLIGKFEGAYAGKTKSTQAKVATFCKALREEWPGGTKRRVSDIKVSEVLSWLAEKEARLAKSSYNEWARQTRKLFEMAVDDGIIVHSPAAKVESLRRDTPIRQTPSWEEFQAIVAEIRAQTQNRRSEASGDFAEFLGLSGIGNSEAANLTWGDINFTRGKIRVLRNKTQTGFEVPIFPQLRPLLKRIAANQSTRPTDSVFQVRDIRKSLSQACERLGLTSYTQRSLRRCFITRAVEQGIDFKTIASWQGHRDGGALIAKTYSHLRTEHADAMAQRL